MRKHNHCNDDFNNERIHFFIKIYLSHLILKKLMLVVCERWVGDSGRTAILTQVHLTTIAALLPHFCLGCSTVGHWGPKPSVWSWFSLRWHLVSDWLDLPGTWLYYCLMPTCFRCSSAYLYRYISWLMARSRVSIHQQLSFESHRLTEAQI